MEKHFINRNNWLRAAVLGANDGILSTTSLIIGVAAANASRSAILLAGLAGMFAGATSMAAGEYVSVSSQTDVEKSDLKREKIELETMPDEELEELSEIYVKRGLDKELAKQVAIQLTQKNALEAHANDELGINKTTKPNPLQAALASAASFIVGAILPVLAAVLLPIKDIVVYQYVLAIVFLAVSGAVAAKIGGSSIIRSVIRICFWGTVAMCTTALAGYLFGVKMN